MVQHVRRLLTVEAAPSVDAIDGIVDHTIRVEPEPSGLLRPAGMQYLGVDRVRLVRTAVDDGFPFQPPALAGRRLTAHRIDEAIELVVHAPSDVGGARRELGEQVGADVAHLGDASFGRMPSDTEARRHLGSQAGVIEGGECLLVVLDQPGVECQPATVGRLDPIGDHEMGVDLRVERPAGVLPKRRRHDPLGVDHRHFPTDPVPRVRVPFDPAGERSDCSIVCGEHFPTDVMVTEGEHHGHGLRRRTCHVEPAHRRVVVRAAECTIGALRIHARHERRGTVRRRLHRRGRAGSRRRRSRCRVARPSRGSSSGAPRRSRHRRRRPSAWSLGRSRPHTPHRMAPSTTPSRVCALVCPSCVGHGDDR